MTSKAISLILLGLALCCFFQSTAAQEKSCSLNFTDSTKYWGFIEGEGNHTYTFSGWYMKGNVNKTLKLYSLKSVKPNNCESCTLAVFSTATFTGKSTFYDFRNESVYQPEITFPFLTKAYTLKCFPPVEEDIDRSGEFPNVEWRQMSEGKPLPSGLVELRKKAVEKAVKRLKAKGVLPEGQYTITQTFATEFSGNYDILYRFNVQVTSDSGVRYKISATMFTSIDDLQNYEFISYAYFEHRVGEFNDPDWREMNEDEDLPLPDDVVQLRSKAVNQAVKRMKAQGILPEGDYIITQTFPTDFNLRIDHPEFPSHDDIIYRFNVQVTNVQAGVRFRVQAVTISSSYSLAEYELIDYFYVENRLAEFADPDWREMNEAEDLPLPDDVVQLRSKAVSQAIGRMKAKGILPEGNYTITKTFPTEFNGRIDHPEFSPEGDYMIYRFNVQITNEASGVRFRIQAVTISSYYSLPKYELIDYFYIENRLGEFSNAVFRRINEEELRGKAVNQAIDRLKAKGVLPEGQYVVTKTLNTEFSAGYEHSEFPLSDGDVLWKFNVEISNGVKVFAVAITNYANPLNYELVDYGKI